MKKVVIIILILGVMGVLGYYLFFKAKVVIAPGSSTLSPATTSMETVNFTTEDGVTIVADWYQPAQEPRAAVLLLHMMPATRKSWEGLIKELIAVDFAVLAIDLRGHGESIKSDWGSLDYTKFTDSEHQASRLDIIGAINFLKEQGFSKERIAIGGASIGANLALDYASRNKEIKIVVLLSPGLDYRGIETQPLIEKLSQNQSVFIAVSKEDSYAFNSSKILAQGLKIKKELKILEGAGHGTAMFEKEPKLKEDIVTWLKSTYQ